jgi:hypothetical protein
MKNVICPEWSGDDPECKLPLLLWQCPSSEIEEAAESTRVSEQALLFTI